MRCFNGAVHRSARKDHQSGTDLAFRLTELQRSRAPECTESVLARLTGGVKAELQRSRAPECTERSLYRLSGEHQSQASTEPCTGVHGKRGVQGSQLSGNSGFNGAVHRSARKALTSMRG